MPVPLTVRMPLPGRQDRTSRRLTMACGVLIVPQVAASAVTVWHVSKQARGRRQPNGWRRCWGCRALAAGLEGRLSGLIRRPSGVPVFAVMTMHGWVSCWLYQPIPNRIASQSFCHFGRLTRCSG